MDGPISRFFGVKVVPKAEAKVGMELVHGQGDDSDDEQPYICSKHLTQVALGSNPKGGRHTVFARAEGEPPRVLLRGCCRPGGPGRHVWSGTRASGISSRREAHLRDACPGDVID